MEQIKNEKLLKTLSIIGNVILLIGRIALAIYFYFIIKGIFQGAKEVGESGEGSIYAVGIFSFLVVFGGVAVFICIVKSIFSATIIIIGIVFRFNKAYTTLSVVVAIFGGINIISIIELLVENISNGEFNIYYFISYILPSIFLLFNAVVQIIFHKSLISKKNKQIVINNNLEDY